MDPKMRGAVTHPLVQKIIAYQTAMARQDFASGATIFAPDVVYVVPGQNALSGTFHGPAEVMGYFGKLMALTSGTYGISDMLWLACHDRVTLITRNHATIGARSLDWDEAIVFVFENGQKKRIDLYQADQAAVDAFYGKPS
jgi:ketosteroid isomerase-like protein